jgi:DNA-binding CsgD family transcriptional regulator
VTLSSSSGYSLGMAKALMTPRGQFILRMLTRREREILPLVCAGFSNRKIAERTLLGDQVVKNYLRGIFKKAGVENRHELVVFAWKHGVVTCPCQARRQFIAQQQVKVDARTTPSPQPLLIDDRPAPKSVKTAKG